MEEAKKLKIRETPALVKVGQNSLASRGFRNIDFVEHLHDHVQESRKIKPLLPKWCEIGCMARTMYGRNIESHRYAIRHRVAAARRYMIERGALLLTDLDKNKIRALKIYDNTSTDEKEFAKNHIERLRVRKEMNEQAYQKAILLVEQI